MSYPDQVVEVKPCDKHNDDRCQECVMVVTGIWHYTGKNFGDSEIWECGDKQRLQEEGTGRVLFDPEIERKKWKLKT